VSGSSIDPLRLSDLHSILKISRLPSAKDVFDSVNALSSILIKHPDWSPNAPPVNMPVVAIRHSNGGQGVWYLASRYPDLVLAS